MLSMYLAGPPEGMSEIGAEIARQQRVIQVMIDGYSEIFGSLTNLAEESAQRIKQVRFACFVFLYCIVYLNIEYWKFSGKFISSPPRHPKRGQSLVIAQRPQRI